MADMAAAVWTACTKLTVFAEKSKAPAKSGALLFMGVFEGCFGKSGCLKVVFSGEVVVNCVVKRGGLMVIFRGLKYATRFELSCGNLKINTKRKADPPATRKDDNKKATATAKARRAARVWAG
jgi:hypothetical protein